MTRTGFSDLIMELVGLLAEMNYSQDAKETTLRALSPLSTQDKVAAVKQFTKIARNGLPESEYINEISQVLKKLEQKPIPKKATKAMIQKTIAPYVQRDGLTVYLNCCDIEELTDELLLKYNNIYCSTSTNKKGGQIFYVNSKARHTKFIAIIVK